MTIKPTQKVWLVMAVVAWCGVGWAEPLERPGKIEAVTVYRGQALVTRVVTFEAPAGAADLVVTELPTQVIPGSLYADSDDVQIRAVRYRAKAVSEEPRPEVRQLDQEIEQVDREIHRNQKALELIQQKEAYLGKLETFSAAKAGEDLDKGSLDAKTLTELTEFLFAQRTSLAEAKLSLGEKRQELDKQRQLLHRRRAELTAKSSRTLREAVVFMRKDAAGEATVRVHYLVGAASWLPTYNARTEADRKTARLEYNALVRQMSGEDWKGVALTLSTASPAMVAEAPILTPLWVTLSPQPVDKRYADTASLAKGQREASQRLKSALSRRARLTQARNAPADEQGAGGQQPGSQVAQDWDANVWGVRLQMMDLVSKPAEALLAGTIRPSDDVLSVNYRLEGPTSIPSRSDQQMIQIASLKLDAAFYYLGVPILTPYVYQEAELVNTSKIALLAGPVSAYLDGQFMGSGRLPMVAKGQKFSVGFGVDSQLRVDRQLTDKTDRIRGGNRELTFHYRLSVENYKGAAVKVRLMDRLPDPQNADIRVTLGKLSDPLIKDEVYERTLRKMGVLKWEVEVPAKSAGATSRPVTYDFKLEFDRNMHLAEPAPAEIDRSRMEFEESFTRW